MSKNITRRWVVRAFGSRQPALCVTTVGKLCVGDVQLADVQPHEPLRRFTKVEHAHDGSSAYVEYDILAPRLVNDPGTFFGTNRWPARDPIVIEYVIREEEP